MGKTRVLPPWDFRIACTICKTLCPQQQKRLIKIFDKPAYVHAFTELSIILEAITKSEESPVGY